MTQRLTPAQENYLEFIQRLGRDGPVRVSDLAQQMGIQRPTVSRAIKALAAAGLVDHRPYGAIELTADGRRAAEEVVRRDRYLTKLLVDVLGMKAAQADPEVHRLEHFVSDDVMRRLEVLVRFALSSEAWIKRLHHRLRTEVKNAGDPGPLRVGETRVHKGPERERNGEARP
jgi:DtxR family transcriptional regulator, Mn-dependent transcriptional regulator